MKLSIELTETEGTKLRDEAARLLGVAPEALARAALADLLRNEDEDFREAAEHVLRKNGELYRRLA
jgi:HEAT repeat protein